ncbi:uncharacterized protein [Argopecten irradians]|uniref:uncharacterized protein n=1 Tax=Argopecten irradians TaxID=31199 RepID=UPI003713F7E8
MYFNIKSNQINFIYHFPICFIVLNYFQCRLMVILVTGLIIFGFLHGKETMVDILNYLLNKGDTHRTLFHNKTTLDKDNKWQNTYGSSAIDSEYLTFERTLHTNGILDEIIDPRTKFIVYDCSKARKDQNGGWSDRIAGIMTTFIISVLSKRKFLINFDMPCLLQDYVMPAHYDWRYNASLLVNRTSSYHNFKNAKHRIIAKYMFDGVDFNRFFKDDVIFLQMNWDFIADFRKRPNVAEDIPWITTYHQVDIYKHIHNFLFKLSPLSVRALHNFSTTQRRRKRIACAHIRRGNNPNMPKDVFRKALPLDPVWEVFDSLNKDEYDLFVASDSDSIKKKAKERFPDNIVDTPGKITHIDRPHTNDPTEGFLKQLLDFYIMIDCDILIVPNHTGFSKLAAFIRNKNYGMYCQQENNLVPCSRYTITDIFPRGKFGIKPTKK